MKRNLLLIFFSFLISFFLIEIFIRIFLPQEISAPWRIHAKDGLLINKNNGISYHYINSKKVKYTFGKYHNRKYNLQQSKKKILVLGDSFTFGWLLNDEDTFIYKLSKNFLNYEFINASAGGWGTSDYLKYLEEFCDMIKPKHTIIFINYMDFSRSKVSNLYYLNSKNEIIEGKNKVYLSDKLTESFIYSFFAANSHLFNLFRKQMTIFILNKRIQDQKTKIQNEKNLKNNEIKISEDDKLKNDIIFIKKLLKKIKLKNDECKSNLILINLGWIEFKNTSNVDNINNYISFIRENSINYIDLTNNMRLIHNEKSKYQIKNDGHPNELANEIIYQLIKDKLKIYIQ